jgi:hypothetical protein
MERFYKIHEGETCLLVGNGENLHLTPPSWFDYPAFGMNTIHKYEGWIPNYYCAVDQRVMREFGNEIAEKYKDIPKFVPRPNLDKWQGENFYRFLHRPGELMVGGKNAGQKTSLTTDGISYRNVMHVAIQVAWYMGFKTMLMIGVHHKPFKAQVHFWGTDHGMPATQDTESWFEGYKTFSRQGEFKLLNISEDTYCPEDVLERDDWRKYESKILA